MEFKNRAMKDTLTKIGIIGDVHCEDFLLQKVIEYMNIVKVDEILCTGDISNESGDILQCCNLLNKQGVKTVRGDHDLLRLRELQSSSGIPTMQMEKQIFFCLSELPVMYEFTSLVGPGLLYHGFGNNDITHTILDKNEVKEEEFSDSKNFITEQEIDKLASEKSYSLIISGHTQEWNCRTISKCLRVDAGTLHSDTNPCFSIIDLQNKFIEYYVLNRDGSIKHSQKHYFTDVWSKVP